MSNQNSPQTHHISEISQIIIENPTIEYFTLSEQIERNEENRISYHLTCNLEKVLIIWEEKKFYALYQPNTDLLTEEEWQNALIQVFTQLPEIGDIHWQFEKEEDLVSNISPYISAKFATQALSRNYLSKIDVYSNKKVKVIRQADYWAERVSLKGQEYPAIALTIKSQISYQGNLLSYYDSQEDKTENNFIGMEVKNLGFDNSGNGRIIGFRGLIKNRRQELLQKPNITARSKEALEKASENQPIVAVKFGKKKQEYHFPLAALSPALTRETALKFGVDWGTLLKKSKIEHSQRQKLLTSYKNEIEPILKQYNITVEKNINTFKYPENFIQLDSLDKNKLLFGKNHVTTAKSILSGLKRGGVYQRHKVYQDEYRIIRLSVFTVIDNKRYSIPIQPVKQRLFEYGFDSELINNCEVNILGFTDIQARIKVEQEVAKFLALPTDIILVGLPTRDENNKDELSLYTRIYSTTLRRKIPTQFIYENTILRNSSEKNLRYLLNQLIPGILAKLGNIPYVLKETLNLADCYIGFDVARLPKEKNLGTMNACASIRMYGKQGEFIRYHLRDSLIAGEEIPKSTLETLLPSSELTGKIVLILRDGRFVGEEIANLVDWAKEIKAQFILVECKKNPVPRLYNWENKALKEPNRGLLLKLSETSGILVTTQVKEKIGLSRPLRLIIRPEGKQASIKDVADIVFKFTLLHYGSLNTTRTPMPIYASDRIGYLRLNGIYPSDMIGDKQFWL